MLPLMRLRRRYMRYDDAMRARAQRDDAMFDVTPRCDDGAKHIMPRESAEEKRRARCATRRKITA